MGCADPPYSKANSGRCTTHQCVLSRFNKNNEVNESSMRHWPFVAFHYHRHGRGCHCTRHHKLSAQRARRDWPACVRDEEDAVHHNVSPDTCKLPAMRCEAIVMSHSDEQ